MANKATVKKNAAIANLGLLIEDEVSTSIPSPLGNILIVANSKGITRVAFDCPKPNLKRANNSPAMDHLLKAEEALVGFFAGRPIKTSALALAPEGTDFQKAVWKKLVAIKYGSTTTYGEIADDLDRPGAARGVGQACGANPIVIIIPCHRVLAANGALGGFSSGIERKKVLLKLEDTRLH